MWIFLFLNFLYYKESEESKCDDCDDSHHSEGKKESLKDTIDNKKKKIDDKLLKEILEHMSKLKH